MTKMLINCTIIWDAGKIIILAKTFSDDFARIKQGSGAIGVCAEKRIVQSFVDQELSFNEKKEY